MRNENSLVHMETPRKEKFRYRPDYFGTIAAMKAIENAKVGDRARLEAIRRLARFCEV